MNYEWSDDAPENAEEAGLLLEALLDSYSKIDLDPDFAAFLLMSAGMVLSMSNNRTSPMVVSHLLASAMKSAAFSVMSNEGEEETKH